MSSLYTLRVKRELYDKVSKETGIPSKLLMDVYSGMWKSVGKIMKSSKSNVIYLRHLGTFHGEKEMIKYVTEAKRKKDLRLLKKKKEEKGEEIDE